jgi:hypothetical protein
LVPLQQKGIKTNTQIYTKVVKMKVNPVVVLVGIILFFAIVFLAFISMPKQTGQTNINLTEKQAILDDARMKYPDADRLDIVNITETTEGSATFLNVKVRVTENYSSTCPQRYHLQYFYPEQKFEPSKPELITKDCHLCSDGNCIIAFEEEAIIASINAPGTEQVSDFVKYKPNTVPSVSPLENNSWDVIWRSGAEKIEVILSNRGDVISIS